MSQNKLRWCQDQRKLAMDFQNKNPQKTKKTTPNYCSIVKVQKIKPLLFQFCLILTFFKPSSIESFPCPHREHTGIKSINSQRLSAMTVSWLSNITWGEECTLESDIVQQGEKKDGSRLGLRLSRDSCCRQVIIKHFYYWWIEDLSEVYYFSSLFIFLQV